MMFQNRAGKIDMRSLNIRLFASYITYCLLHTLTGMHFVLWRILVIKKDSCSQPSNK